MKDNCNISFFNGTDIVRHTKTNQKIYHYTSPSGLYSIIKDKKLWFTDCQFMNDKSEYVYIKKVLIKALKLSGKNNIKDLEEYANYILMTPYESLEFGKRKNNKLFSIGMKKYRYYLFCTSLKADSYSMWNYFTKNGNCAGYNICFDVESFVNLFASLPNVTLAHGKVIYDEQEQIKQVKDKIENLDAQYNEEYKLIKGHEFSNDYGNENNQKEILIDNYQEHLSEFLQERCLFFKNHAFESEDEYRFVVKVSSQYSEENFKLNHRVGNNGVIIPYRELDFEPKCHMNEITLAPMMEKEIAKAGLISLLGLSYEKEFDIKYSKIDVRF